MSVLLSSVVVGLMAFAPAEPIYPADPYLTLNDPNDGFLPSNADVFFVGSVDSSTPPMEVLVNGAAVDVEFSYTGISFDLTEGMSEHLSVKMPELEVNDDVVLRHPLLGDDLQFEVVEADGTAPRFDDDAFELGWRGTSGGCDNPLNPEPCSRHGSVQGPTAVDDNAVAYYRLENDDGDTWGKSLNGSAVVSAHFDNSVACVRSVAIDIAGNEGSTELTCLDLAAGGCSHVSAGDDGVPLGGLALLALLMRRRRRRGGR